MGSDNNNNQSGRGIDELNKKLYKRDGGNFQVRRSNLSPNYDKINKTWDERINFTPTKSPNNIWLKVLFFSFLFFLLAIGVAWFIFFQETNVVSDKNIEVVINGPVSLKAGDELGLQIALTNKNVMAIDQVELMTTWPEGSLVPTNTNKQSVYTTQKIGQINIGETINVATKAIVYGRENDELEIKFNLGYHLVGSNTLFEKEVIYRIKITASPIDLEVIIPSEINSNQELNLNLKISSNTDKPLNNILLEVIYPPGFQFKSASVPFTYSPNKWLLGDLLPGVEQVINIKGVIEGQAEELKSFQVRIGVKDLNQEQSIAVLYNDFFKTLVVKKSFLGLAFFGKEPAGSIPFTIKNTGKASYTIDWVNNLPVNVKDLQIVAHLTGDALDKNSIRASGGYYSSVEDTITWNKHTIAGFDLVEPGATGKLSLDFSTLSYLEVAKNLKNAQIYIDLMVTGMRVSEGFANEKVQTDLSRIIKIDSVVNFDAKTFYHEGPLINTGLIPPKVGYPTTYTLTWSLQNFINDLKSATVETSLPLGVEWVGVTSPTNEVVSYDFQKRQVVWDLGFVPASTIESLVQREVSFQVSITPSINQFDQTINLTRVIDFKGIDSFTGSNLLIHQDVLTTLLSDIKADDKDGKVIK